MQKLLSFLACASLTLMLLSCGNTPKKDSEEKLGVKDGKLVGGGDNAGNGGGTDAPTEDFAVWCSRIGIPLGRAMCKHRVGEAITIAYPKDFTGAIFRQQLPSAARKGWLVQTVGDPNEAAVIYEADNETLTPFITVGATVKARRMEGEVHGLFLIATAPYEKPAVITLWECVDKERHTVLCPPQS